MSFALQTARDEAGKRPVGDAVRYIQARLALMHYADARRRGLPIGSGAVEAMRLALETSERQRDPAAARAAAERPTGGTRRCRGSSDHFAKPVHIVASRHEALHAAA